MICHSKDTVFDMIIADCWDETLEQFAFAIRGDNGKVEAQEMYIMSRLVRDNFAELLEKAIVRKVERG